MDMYFPPSEYNKKIKISTRCYVVECLKTLNNLNPPLTSVERNWFQRHPQFRHFFHMPTDKNHKLMGMWMLLLRTARMEREKEVWFLVNGVPIRYGIREHALMSGLNCKNYPLDFKQLGSMKFVQKYFGVGATVRYHDVKAKLVEMTPSTDRLKMAVLYFLSSIIIGQTKTGKDAPSVEPFFLKAVDDLNLCKNFPWGRLSFDYMLKEISHTMSHFGGAVKEGVLWPISGFCIPLELLAFEAIPELGRRFREPCIGAEATCPRMCKSMFKKGEMKGFPLSRIYEELGTTKDIDSILIPAIGEENLLHDMTEPDDDVDIHDVVAESWNKRLKQGFTLFFEDMFIADVDARSRVTDELCGPASSTPALAALAAAATSSETQNEEVVAALSTMKAAIKQLELKVDKLEGRLKEAEEKLDEGDRRAEKRPRIE